MLEFMSLVEKIRSESRMNRNQMMNLTDLFYEDMDLRKSLRMMPAHIFVDNSIKPGQYVALDFGGSNVRIMLYEIFASGGIELLNSKLIPLRGNFYDFTTEEYELKDIFGVIVNRIKEIVEEENSYLLGHTFSFPIEIKGRNESTIVAMTKGFNLKNAIGQDVNAILKSEIDRVGLKVTPVSILNDSIATLLAGRLNNPNTDIACIVGTGHNICFIDNDNQLINTECGSFNMGIPISSYDEQFLALIPQEKNALMEAFVGGKNSGKIAENYKRIIESEYKNNLNLDNITPKLLSMATEDKYGELKLGIEERVFLNNIAKSIFNRAAQLVVCEIMAILRRIDPELERAHNIVFDGSVYEKTPYFRKCLTKYITIMYGEKSKKITHSLMKDGSSLGAAISAAM